MKSIFIFIPDTLNYNQITKLEGFVKKVNDTLSFFIIRSTTSNNSLNTIGFCSDNAPKPSINSRVRNESAWIHINYKTGQISVNDINENVDNKITCIVYDYYAFTKSDINTFNCENYGEYFSTLSSVVQNDYVSTKNGHSFFLLLFLLTIHAFLGFLTILLKVLHRLQFLLQYSATAIHLYQTVDTIKWALNTLKQKRKVTLIVGNVIVSKITDFVCGVALLYFIMQYEFEFMEYVQYTTESIIQALEHLLNFLMGSPVGLKLNFTFNKTLGTFFLYHIALWRAFLHATSPLLRLGLYLLIVPGACGLSFQAALLSDLITFSTFHVYCIYVYAARFYGVQIKTLISLWRLFIGRKYNPLRKRVDSHQYSHHQLFIGTLGFTMLFFLLPTTFLYYAVFTAFRVFLVSLDGFLLRLRYCLQYSPIYVVVLWLKNSPCVKGSVKLLIQNKTLLKNCTIYVTLQTLPLWQSILSTLPEIVIPINAMSWKVLFGSIVMGSLI